MPNGKIVITFNSDFADGEYITVKRRVVLDILNLSIETMTWTDIDPRPASFLVPVRTPTGTPGEKSRDMYGWLFSIDYGYGGIYQVTYPTTNSIQLQFINDEWEFYDFVTDGDATEVITPPTAPPLVLDSATPEEATILSVCSYIGIAIETTGTVHQYRINGGSWTIVDSDSFVIEIIRGIAQTIELENSAGYSVWTEEFYFDYLNSKLANVTITPTIVGATVKIEDFTIEGLAVTYSIDGINYFASNIFTGQSAGAGEIYMKDEFGCIQSVEYEVLEAGFASETTPFLFLSKANSINFSFHEHWDGYTIFKNDQNTLAFQSVANILQEVYCETLLFQTDDVIPTQFKSNFATPSAVVRDEDENETALSIIKKTSNLARFESMDCIIYLYREGKMGIYFDNGWTYDEIGAQLEEYDLGGNLPDFAIIGVDVSIAGVGGFPITDVVYDETIKKRVIVVDFAYAGTDFVTDKISTIYNLLPYEVYEFDVDWSVFGEGLFDVIITNEDANMDTLYLTSENISILDEHPDTLAIRYFNANNRDIFYKYGIEHFIRIPFLSIVGKPKDESEINITDLSSQVVTSSVYEVDEITFDAVTKEVMRKLCLALSCETIFINGIGYIKDGGVRPINIPNTNLYEVQVDMLKTNINHSTDYGNNYNNNEDGAKGVDNISRRPQVTPILIDSGDGFIKT